MKQHKNPKIDVVCAYCEFLHIEKDETGEEEFSCKYKKNVEADGHCFRFRYDILKRKPEELAKAKFVELFAANSQNIQIFFSDLFGIEDVYNKPGTSGDKNWSLRLPNNFEWFYFNQLARGKALNLAEILAYALKVRGLDKENTELMEKLNHYASI